MNALLVRTTSRTCEVLVDGTIAVMIYLAVIGALLAICAIISATKKQWVAFTVYAVLAAMCLGCSWYKPKADAKRERDQRQAEEQVLERYPEIRKIVSLERAGLEITYVNERGQRCSTTLVDRDDQWLVNTQTADCK